MSESLQYSSEVNIHLIAEGKSIEVAGCLGAKCTLRQPVDLAPCHAELVIVIDGVERRRKVYLPKGISKSSQEVELC